MPGFAELERLTPKAPPDSAELRERHRCAEIVAKWTRTAHIRLCAGEMTASEIRAVKAVISAILREVTKSN